MFDLDNLINYRDVSLVQFNDDIDNDEMIDTIDSLSQKVLEQGSEFVFDISENEMDDLSNNHYNLDISVNLYDHRLNNLSKKLDLTNLLNARNKEFDKTPTYILFVIWVLISIILLFVLGMYVVDDSLNLNLFVKAMISLLLLFVFYFFFNNVYRFLSRNS